MGGGVLSICGTLWGQNRIDYRQTKLDSSIFLVRFGKKTFREGGGGVESLWHLLGSKPQFISTKRVRNILDIIAAFCEKKSTSSGGGGWGWGRFLSFYGTFWDQNHTWLSVKQDEIWLLRSRGPRDASSSKGLQGCNSNRGSTDDVGRLRLGTSGALFSPHSPILSSFFVVDFFPQYHL